MVAKVRALAANPPTGIRAIAEELGISVATVHRALYNRGRVSDITRSRVLKVAKQINYEPNLFARNLKLNHCFRISVLLPSAMKQYFDFVQAGIKEGAAQFSSALVLDFHDVARHNRDTEESLRAAIATRTSGIIVAPKNSPEIANLIKEARENGIPTICVSTDSPQSGRLTAITANPFCSGSMAAEVLASSSKKPDRFAVLTGDLRNLSHSEKLRGFRSMLAQISPRSTIESVIDAHDEPNVAYHAMGSILQRTPRINGLYVTSANAIPALKALREIGQGEGISAVTTDLFPELVPYIREGIVKATLFQSPRLQGTLAIQAMYLYLAAGTAPIESIQVIPQLVMQSNLELYLGPGMGPYMTPL